MNPVEEKRLMACWEKFQFCWFTDYQMGLVSWLDEKGRYCRSASVRLRCVGDFYAFCKTAQFPSYTMVEPELRELLLKLLPEFDEQAGADKKKRTEDYLAGMCA